MLALLLLTAPLACQTCADCGLAKEKVLLCARHLEEERAAFADTRKQLASALAAERIAGLGTLSGLTRTHVNAPSEKVARRIGDFLADESPEVRERAAGLLGPPQHAILSMQALLEALNTEEKDLRRLRAERKELLKKLAGSSLREQQEKALETDLARNEAAQTSLLEWRRTVVGQLGRFPDDRVVTSLCDIADPLVAAPGKARALGDDDALHKWLALKEPDERLLDAIDLNGALVRLGNRQAIRTVVVNLGVLQSEIADMEGFRTSFGSLQDMVKSLLHGLTEARDRTKQEIEAALSERRVALPENRSLPWLLAWMQENTDSFPEHLPGVVSPAW